MSHDRELADQDVEEMAEELCTLSEEGRDRVDELYATSQAAAPERTLAQLVARGLARIEGDRVELTREGSLLGERQVRRHRLTEVLFSVVLQVQDDAAVNRTACVIEHVLDATMTDSVCAFLGHPKLCPHGKPVPSGACCRGFAAPPAPLVQPLDRLPVGRSGRVIYIAPREPERLVRLSSLGIVPGAIVHLQQVRPAAVLRVGETTLAVEPELAAEIYVKAEA